MCAIIPVAMHHDGDYNYYKFRDYKTPLCAVPPVLTHKYLFNKAKVYFKCMPCVYPTWIITSKIILSKQTNLQGVHITALRCTVVPYCCTSTVKHSFI